MQASSRLYPPAAAPPHDFGCSCPWLSSANRSDTRALCFRNFSQHLVTHCGPQGSRVRRRARSSLRKSDGSAARPALAASWTPRARGSHAAQHAEVQGGGTRTTSSFFSSVFRRKVSTQLMKHRSTKPLYIFRLRRVRRRDVEHSSSARWIRSSGAGSTRLTAPSPVTRLHRLDDGQQLILVRLWQPVQVGRVHLGSLCLQRRMQAVDPRCAHSCGTVAVAAATGERFNTTLRRGDTVLKCKYMQCTSHDTL
jgi:hypothetical protein